MKILVPTDFSDLSLKAVSVANKYASQFDGKVYLFHSHLPISEIEDSYALGMTTQTYQNYDEIEDNLKAKLQQVADEKLDKSVFGDIIVGMGNPAQSIIDASEEMDMIILSTHGRTGFRRFLLGSVSEKVLRMAQLPVMVVENESDIGELKDIVVTTDFSDNSYTAFSEARKIAAKSGGNVTILHILSYHQVEKEDSDKSLETIREQRLKVLEKEYFHELGKRVSSKVIMSDRSPQEAIANYLKKNPCNLIVMATVGRTGLSYLMMGSTTANVVRHSETAVLSVPPVRSES